MHKKTKILALAAGIALATGLSGCGIAYDGDTTNCTVTDKYVALNGKTSEKRIGTTCGVFQVEDELSQGQWNSADVYNRIEVGKTYDLVAYGPRNGFLSLFPNVSEAVEVAQ